MPLLGPKLERDPVQRTYSLPVRGGWTPKPSVYRAPTFLTAPGEGEQVPASSLVLPTPLTMVKNDYYLL